MADVLIEIEEICCFVQLLHNVKKCFYVLDLQRVGIFALLSRSKGGIVGLHPSYDRTLLGEIIRLF
jgi:hypothetical protein